MSESRTIPPTNASFPEYLDFQTLRAKGIEHCQKLGSELWTDFNLHDPGLTILEALCYAITDLGYRTNLPIKDLLATDPNQNPDDRPLKETADDPAGDSVNESDELLDDNFFTAEQILTCNPVTLLDVRKLLLEIKGVRNAWIKPAEKPELEFYLNHDEENPRFQSEEIEDSEFAPDGLYQVCLELDDRLNLNSDSDSSDKDRIEEDAKKLLARHRNLCEDFIGKIVILGDERIGLTVQIEIEAQAIPDDILEGIYQGIDEFLSPPITFYNLKDLLDKGRTIEEIYAGRPLTPLNSLFKDRPDLRSHGFIDLEQLKRSERRSELHASDLYRVIMDVPGVLAVRDLTMYKCRDSGSSKGALEKWSLDLKSDHRQIFDLGCSDIFLYKGQLARVNVAKQDIDRVNQRIKSDRSVSEKSPLSQGQLDRPIPKGRYRKDIQEFRSIAREFPLVYGIGDGGLPDSASAKRKAQAHQLKAYLLFFEQILANYLAQLANLRELFSMRPQHSRTYFTQIVKDMPGVVDLVENYNGCGPDPGYPTVPETYPNYLNHVVESSEDFVRRRNQFLDHLLARFAESFTDYVLLMFDVNGQRNDDDGIIRNKTSFLRSYPETSRNRGRGFDYKDSSPWKQQWNSDNVSGLENRVRRLLAIGDSEIDSQPVAERAGHRNARGQLCPVKISEVESKWHWLVELVVEGPEDSVTLTSSSGYAGQSEAGEAYEQFCKLAKDDSHYRRLFYSSRFAKTKSGTDGTNSPDPDSEPEFGFVVVDENDNVIVEANGSWKTAEIRDAFLIRLMQIAIGGKVRCELDQSDREGAYRVDLLTPTKKDEPDIRKEIAWSGTEILSSRTQAEDEHFPYLVSLAQDRQRYQPTADGPQSCPFGIVLRDENQNIVARHPRYYNSTEKRDAVWRRIYGFAVDGDSIPSCDYLRPRIRFRIVEQDRRCWTSTEHLVSTELYNTDFAAKAAFENVLGLAMKNESYVHVDKDGEYTFEIRGDDKKVLARHPVTYRSKNRRDEAVAKTKFFVKSHGVPYEIFSPKRNEFRFQLFNNRNERMLDGVESEMSEPCALNLIINAISFAMDPNNYDDLENDQLEDEEPIDEEPIDEALDDEALDDEALDDEALAEEAGFGFRLLDEDRNEIAIHPNRYETREQRDEVRDEWIEFMKSLEINGAYDPESYQFQVADAKEEFPDSPHEILLLSTDAWEKRVDAEAAYGDFLPLALDDSNYARTFDNQECEYTFSVVKSFDDSSSIDPNPVASHLTIYKTRRPRDEKIQRTLELLNKQGLRSDIHPPHRISRGHFFRLVAGEIELTSESHYPYKNDAGLACARLLARLTDSDSYSIEPSGDQWRLAVVDPDSGTRAASKPDSRETIEKMQTDLIVLAGATPHSPRLEQTNPSYRYHLVSPQRLVSAQDQQNNESLDGQLIVMSLEGQIVLSRISGFDSSETRDQALSATREFFGRSPKPKPEIIEQVGRFRFAFRVNESLRIEEYRSHSSQEKASEAADEFLRPDINQQGYYRRRNSNTGDDFGFDILDSRISEDHFVLHAMDEEKYRHVSSSEYCLFGFELVVESRGQKMIARPVRFAGSPADRDENIRVVRSIAGIEGFHLVEHILLRPLVDKDDDTFLPIREEYREDDGKLSVISADNYSFVATVVVPFWPQRFRAKNFRRFFERTIRTETPAHVFLKIYWVDVAQMREFETRFEAWLDSVPDKREDARRALVEIMSRLRNVYSIAKLAHGSPVDKEDSVVLNKTVLFEA